MKSRLIISVTLILSCLTVSCQSEPNETIELKTAFQRDFKEAALDRTKQNVIYNGQYFSMDYPNGDIPSHFGVCTDVIVRSYRKIGVDMQELIHEDISDNFNDYPISRHWPDQPNADYNIDHRRVPNMEAFFTKYGQNLPVSKDISDYLPGDIVTYNLDGGSPWHVAIVSNVLDGDDLEIIHNIGYGPKLGGLYGSLFDHKIRGHYRYIPEKYKEIDD